MQILANQELVSGKVVGSNLGTGKGFFPHKISVKVCLCIQLWILFHIVTYAWLVTNVSNFQTQFLKLFSNSFQELSTFSRQRKVKNIRTDLSKKKKSIFSFFSFCKKPIGGGFSQKKINLHVFRIGILSCYYERTNGQIENTTIKFLKRPTPTQNQSSVLQIVGQGREFVQERSMALPWQGQCDCN